MNNLNRCLALSSLVFLLAGCVGNRTFVVSQAVGPRLQSLQNGAGNGSLLVYSAWDGLDTLDPDHEKHTGYAIFSTRGTMIESVRNRCGSFDQEPMVVSLPVGTYRVEARATNLGFVSIPVQIEENQTTIVYLDGMTKPRGVDPSDGNLIKLPNGQIVGWRASVEAAHLR